MSPDGFLADVLAEPQALRAVASAYADGQLLATVPERARVLFLGMGSSRFAALDAAAALCAHGVDARVEYASTGRPQPPSRDTLCVAVSAGGASRETLAALERHRGTSTTVAVTNRGDSPLARACDLVVPLDAGDEAGGVASRTFHATVAVLQLLAARILGEPVEPALTRIVQSAAALDTLLERRDAWLPPVVEAVDGGPLWIAAPAERLGSAEQSALMFREGPRIAAHACESGDWSHVDVYLSKHPGYRLLLLGGSAWETELLRWLREREATFVTVGRPLDGAAAHVALDDVDDPERAALVETVVAELAAQAIWRTGTTLPG